MLAGGAPSSAFVLVRDADGGDVAGLQAGALRCFAGGVELASPDLVRVVFEPARLRVSSRCAIATR